MFCDWLNVWQQFDGWEGHDYLGGRVVSVEGACGLTRASVVDGDGALSEAWTLSGAEEIEYSTAKFALASGSYETAILIRMVNGRLEVRGNPSAYGRLDNLFGVGLDDGIAVYNTILAGLGLPTFSAGEAQTVWLQNEQRTQTVYTGAHVTRADFTENQAVGMGRVRDYHQWLARQKLSRSGPDDEALEQFARWDYATVYTSSSKYWINAKHYDKSAALEDRTLPEYLKKLRKAARDGKISRGDVRPLYQEAEDYLMKLAEWCAQVGVTRSEWSIRNRWFAQHEGSGWWRPEDTEAALREAVEQERGKIAMRAIVYQADALDTLSDREHRIYGRWKDGINVRDELTKPTFYRLRASILEKTGHDIAARPLLGDRVSEFRPIYFQVRPLTVGDAPSWYQRPSAPLQLAA